MYILGISSYYHDSAAALIRNGKVLCAFEEERFTRIKHDNSFPYNAAIHCLKEFNLKISDINFIGYYEKPLLKFERIIDTFVQTYPKSLTPFIKGMPEWLDYKIKIENIIRKKLKFKNDIFYIPHHMSHAAASYFPSPFKKAAVLTIDGVGEYETTVLWKATGNQLKSLKNINFPHSLGLFYSTFTSFLGFKVNNDEYKMMGLAAYGKPAYVNKILKTIDIKNDGSFKLNLKFYSFRESFKMWSPMFEKEFGKPRKYGGKITERDRNLAASVQAVTEMIYFRILSYLHSLTDCDNLCLGGGVALNSLANGRIYANTLFKEIYNFGAAGDDGAAIGAALCVYKSVLNKPGREQISNLCLGSSFRNDYIENILKDSCVKYKKFESEEKLLDSCVDKLVKDNILGWFQGKMEFGPRALGSRSIIANPKHNKMKSFVNLIKRREKFRPFAGSVLKENVQDLFEIPKTFSNFPFMNFCFCVKENKKSLISAIVHRDNTCRIQMVNREDGRYYKLIKKFYKSTGIPCILNTSFNVDGEPIVENPRQALKDFLSNPIDHLVIGDFIVSK